MRFSEQLPAAENEKSFESKCELLGNAILSDLEQSYPAEHEDPHQKFEYHNRTHSEGVGNMADTFLQKLPGYTTDTRRRALVRLRGYGHDIDQDHIWVTAGGGLWQERKRNSHEVDGVLVPDVGRIEEKSLTNLEEREAAVGIILTENEPLIQKEGIMVTVPAFGLVMDPENPTNGYRTILQENLKANSSPETFAIAAADIASAGYNTARFLQDGDNVFREDHRLPRPETLNDEDAQKILDKALDWTKFQIEYAKGQKILWMREMVPAFLKAQLTEFDETISQCETKLFARRALASTGETPQEKARLIFEDMGFTRYI
jgi:hypothetical protein